MIDIFDNNHITYKMRLFFDGVRYHVTITPLYGINIAYEDYEFDSYEEACKKFTSVFRWNHGKFPALPTFYDCHGTTPKFIYGRS